MQANKKRFTFKKVSILSCVAVAILGIAYWSYGAFNTNIANREVAMTLWSITQGIINAILSPARVLTLFKA